MLSSEYGYMWHFIWEQCQDTSFWSYQATLFFCDIDKEISCISDEEWETLLLFYKVTSEETLPAYMIERLEHDQRIA